jgi:hypothetical protein
VIRRAHIAIFVSLILVPAVQSHSVPPAGSVPREFPPVRSRTPAPAIPEIISHLDEPWQFCQILYDVDTTFQGNWQQYLNAVPVGLAFTHEGRGFLATLHTIFRTGDYGGTWVNMDPRPPPDQYPTEYSVLRAPNFVSGLAARPVHRTPIRTDTLLLTTFNSDQGSGTVRLVYYIGSYHVHPLSQLTVDYWLTGVAIPDSHSAFAFAGLDGRLYGNDSLTLGNFWHYLNPEKVLIRSGRQDSLTFSDTWVAAACGVENLIMAAGSHQWISRDGGLHWIIRPAADPLFDNAVGFADSLHGLAGAGTVTPTPHGWVHFTSDGGRTWSGRTLQTDLPIRVVAMASPSVGFAAGGLLEQNTGAIWRTEDGGLTWQMDVQLNADVRALGSVRVSTAYVDVIAAGVFSDFSGVVWKNRLLLPDSSSAVLMATPDTLDFGTHAPGVIDTLWTILHNIGSLSDTITSVVGTTHFYPVWQTTDSVPVNPGQEIPMAVIFHSTTAGDFTETILVLNRCTGPVTILCRGRASVNALPEAPPALPGGLSLAVWPNPANASFQIRFAIPRDGLAYLRVFDLSGRLVETLAETRLAAGDHARLWDASRFPSGIYFLRLDLDDRTARTEKLLLLK